MRHLVQNEIRLIELATATTSTFPIHPMSSFTNHPGQLRTEPDKNQLIDLLKVEEDKVKQNLMEIESLLVFNYKTQNRHSKYNLSFNHHIPHIGQQPTIKQLPVQQQAFQQPLLQQPPLQQDQAPKYPIHYQGFTQAQPNRTVVSERHDVQFANSGDSFPTIIDQYHQSASFNDAHQPILSEAVLNRITVQNISGSDSRFFQPLQLGESNHNLHMGSSMRSPGQADLISALDQPLADHLQESDSGTRAADPDTLDRDTLQLPTEFSGVDELDLNQMYFDQLIILFEIRFQALRLPESLSRVVI